MPTYYHRRRDDLRDHIGRHRLVGRLHARPLHDVVLEPSGKVALEPALRDPGRPPDGHGAGLSSWAI